MTSVLQFGIPSLDALFGRHWQSSQPVSKYEYGAYGIQLKSVSHPTSISIIGPDGTGKSVFGLHLAAQYMADVDVTHKTQVDEDEGKWHPRAIYVSTDLKHHVAEVMWENFGLFRPNQRDFPFNRACRLGRPNVDRTVCLAKLDPADLQSALDDSPDPEKTKVHFIDLVSKTMGDDWAFINRLVAALRPPAEGRAPNILIIDAVEGFETLVGEKDAFGEITSRRARIAQIMRTAGEKCHVCFIVEEPKRDERFPEEFVTDVVLRLRCVDVRQYSRRTVEILKARGQSHVRGQHLFVIRDGKLRPGGTKEPNADDPYVKNAYVHIFPSLHSVSREEMKFRDMLDRPRGDRVAAFGITYLDDMLTRTMSDSPHGLDEWGLPAQTTTALIGEFATQKTSLATAFMARTFRVFIFRLASVVRELTHRKGLTLVSQALRTRLSFATTIHGLPNDPKKDRMVFPLLKAIRNDDYDGFKSLIGELGIDSAKDLTIEDCVGKVRLAGWLAESFEDNGAAVLITTSNQDRGNLVGELEHWLARSLEKALNDWPDSKEPLDRPFWDPLKREFHNHLISRTICRRLELHDLSSATLFQVIQRSVERAQEKVFLSDDLQPNEDRLPYVRKTRFHKSWNIRVVLDDLSTLKDAYPEIDSDPIFLPFLLSFLEREGVTSLIVDSRMGRPDVVVNDALDRELRALVLRKILNWRVPFMGQIREAISVGPPDPRGVPSPIRELRWQRRKSGSERPELFVDPELELYSGLERGDVPRPIPLEVRLYGETHSTVEYIRQQNDIFGRLFTPLANGADAKVIIGVEAWPYDSLHDLCNLQTHTPLDHTLVIQVDEFWATDRGATGSATTVSSEESRFRREGSLLELNRYLTEPTATLTWPNKHVADRVVDPYSAFQGEPIRLDPPATKASEIKGPWERRHYFMRSSKGRIHQENSNQLPSVDRIPYTWDFGFLLCPSSIWIAAEDLKIGVSDKTVGDVWNLMPSVIRRENQSYVSWRDFLAACKTVAQSALEPIQALDVSTLAGESFTCIVLEIWASEIYDSLKTDEEKKSFRKALGYVDRRSNSSEGIANWLEKDSHILALYKTWLLLIDVVALSDLFEGQLVPHIRVREADGRAAATRHWYKTACGHQKCPMTNELSLPVRLPGHFSVRGDWFLAVAGGSRSERLACRALDLFSTRHSNFRRLELGIGLPTRDIAARASHDHLPTALLKRTMGATTAVSYGELTGTGIGPSVSFSWLWRSQLHHYHRHSRILQKWIGQVAERFYGLQKRFEPAQHSGFSVYDEIVKTGRVPRSSAYLLPWKEFRELCGQLKAQLNIASGSAPSHES
jgi:KaiC/GvpD/RAD55 family RecA-like ATPase